jgi:hypothetical protein
MDLSALGNSIKTLERSLDCWTFWLVLATLLVVIGLLLEDWHEVRDLLKEKPVKWIQVQKIIGAILVTQAACSCRCEVERQPSERAEPIFLLYSAFMSSIASALQ